MLKNIYGQKVTILNKLKKADSPTNLDIWQKTVIEDAVWYSKVERTVTNSTVAIGSYITCLIPFHDEYLPYTEWRQDCMYEDHFTMSSGDYIVLGEIEEDEITPQNIVATMQKYEPNVCTVKHCTEAPMRFGATVQLMVEGT